MGVFQTPIWACDHRFVPPLFLVAVPGDLIPASPRYEVGKGAAFDAAAHVRLRGMPNIRSVLRSHDFGFESCTNRPPLAPTFRTAFGRDMGPRFRLRNPGVAGLVFTWGSRAR